MFGFLGMRHVESYLPDQGSNLHPSTGRWSLNHWTIREVLGLNFLLDIGGVFMFRMLNKPLLFHIQLTVCWESTIK